MSKAKKNPNFKVYIPPEGGIRRFRTLLKNYNISYVENKEVNEAQKIITVLYKNLNGQEVPLNDYLIFREIIDRNTPKESKKANKPKGYRMSSSPKKKYINTYLGILLFFLKIIIPFIPIKTFLSLRKYVQDIVHRISLALKKISISLWPNLGILLFFLNIIIPFISVSNLTYNNPVIGLVGCYYLMSTLMGYFVFSFIKYLSRSKEKHTRIKKLVFLYLYIFSLVTIGVMVLVFNLVLEGIIWYSISFVFLCYLLPLLLKSSKRTQEKESQLPWISKKNKLKTITTQIRAFKVKFYSKKERRRFLQAIFFTFNLSRVLQGLSYIRRS